jgi:VWFA-related protein
MHQNGPNRHPKGTILNFFVGAVAVNRRRIRTKATLLVWAVVVFFGVSALGQSSASQSQGNAQSQDIPDAPSAVQPPAPKPTPPPVSQAPPNQDKEAQQTAQPSQQAQPTEQSPQEQQAPPPMPPVQTVPPGSIPTNQINPGETLYKLVVPVNFVLLPVMVKDSQGRRVDGLLPKDFAVIENGKKQTLTYFTSDPFQLSVAILLDTGMPDVVMQKVNQTYTALMGAFSPYDEVALYTYSSTVSQVTDFTQRTDKMTAVFNDMKLNVVGHNNGPPVLGGPLGPQPPMINGIPVGTSGPPPIYTPPREARVLNDAILRAALDLSKRDKTRRRVIFVISDGRELGSRASYRDVLKLLQTRDIQVKGVVLDSGALPVYRQLEKIHLRGQGYGNILPRYISATGGGQAFSELSRNAIEEAYAQITSEARNQYTLGYTPSTPPPGKATAYRDIEVAVDRKNLSVFTKPGYYPIPTAR